MPACDRSADLVGNAIGFVVAGCVEHNSHGATRIGIGDQSFRLATRVVGNQPVGRAENIGGAAVVVFELNHCGRRVVAFEFKNVTDACATPAVDRLIGITRNG